MGTALFGGLGATKTSSYIYASPYISVIAGILILDEPLTLGIVFGIVLVLIGLVLSEKRYTKEAPIEK